MIKGNRIQICSVALTCLVLLAVEGSAFGLPSLKGWQDFSLEDLEPEWFDKDIRNKPFVDYRNGGRKSFINVPTDN